MKNSDYYEQAISFDSLYKGLKLSCRNVRWKDSIIAYEHHGLYNTYKLRNSLKNNTYKISPYQKFTIYEPKKRVIQASRIQDRQFQRALCENGLYDDIIEHFIRDNVACQKGRGTDDALSRMKVHLLRFYRKHGKEGWVLKCDIHHYFPETSHKVAKAAVIKYVRDRRAAKAVCDVIDSFGGDKGIGLGSQISQLVELLVLNDLDHYIKEQLHIKYYIRYMDDFILIHEDKEYLRYCRKQIANKLAEMGLVLNKKTTLFPLKQGVRFLKWKFVLTDSGKVLMLLDPKKIKRQKRRMKKLFAKELNGKAERFSTEESLRSFLANCQRGNTYQIREHMKVYYADLTGEEFHASKISRKKDGRVATCRAN